MTTTTHTTREGWLQACAQELREHVFAPCGATVPEVRISCGWPSTGCRGRRIGEAWSASASADSAHETFVSPVLDESTRVADVLAHELVHHAVGVEHGHKAPFKKLARRIGLEGKITATIAGERLQAQLDEIVERIGPYPHASLSPSASTVKKQGTRMLKCECGDCGYTCRTTAKWLDAYGAPLCPCNQLPMAA